MINNLNSVWSVTKSSQNKKRVILYDSNPFLFEYDNDVFMPTAYLLNIFPNMLKRKCFIYDETDSYLDNGADLMLKGVLNKDEIKVKDNFKLNDIFAVQSASGLVTSIGISLVSNATMIVNPPQGKFLKILHRINDGLWIIGNKKVPNVITIVEEPKKEPISESIQNEPIFEEIKKEEETTIKEINNNENLETDQKEEIEENDNQTISDFKLNIPVEEMDKNIEILFLTICKLHLKENPELLPLDPGKLLKDFLKPLSIEMILPLDFKLSSHKKINNYLKFLKKEKKSYHFWETKRSAK